MVESSDNPSNRPTWYNEILPNLFLGGVKSTEQQSELDQMGITHILSLGVEARSAPTNLVKNVFIDVDDHELADIFPHLPGAVEFIGQALESGGKVLVHCFAGSSRSGSCVIAYIMKPQKKPYFDSLRFVQSKRSLVRPNLAFGK